jgi:cytochrome b pre-mRNA-processing protein 3
MATRVMSWGLPGLTLEQSKRVVRAVWMVLAVLLLAAGLFWVLGAEQRAINAMEPGKRAAVFQQSFATFETLCGEYPGEALMGNCRRQARFLWHFPECDVVCRSEVSRFVGEAAR